MGDESENGNDKDAKPTEAKGDPLATPNPQQNPAPPAPTPVPAPISAPADQPLPPMPPGTMPQLAGAMLGINIGQPQQNPVVVQHICQYLAHDSDNRLRWFQERGKKSHVFRMTALIIVAILAVIVLAIPLTALARGDMPFVKDFLDHYLSQIIIIVLALLGGGKLFDLLK